MVQFVFVLDPAQYADRVFNARLIDINRLEPTLERGILLDILLVFVERGRTDAMQFAPRKRRLEQVAGIHAAFRCASPDQRVHFIDEQDDLPFGAFDLVEYRLQPLFEFAAIFRARDQCAQVERHQCSAFKAVGHVAIGDTQGEAFGNRSLARSRFADKSGVVLGTAGEDLDRPTNFLVSADYRVELAVARRLRKVARILLHGVVTFLRARTVRSASLGHVLDRRFQ